MRSHRPKLASAPLGPSKLRDRAGVFVTAFILVATIVSEVQKSGLVQALTLGVVEEQIAALQAGLNNLFGIVRRVIRVFARALRHIISDILHLRFVHLWRDYLALVKRLHDWFEKHFGWLLELRRRFDLWWSRTVLPILNFLQRVRQVLAIFRIFHLKFAEKLDNLLLRLESRIIRNTLVLRGRLNLILTWINLVLDPLQVIRRNPLWGQIARAFDAIAKVLGLGGIRGIRGGAPTQDVTLLAPQHFTEVRKEIREAGTTPTGTLGDLRESVLSTFAALDHELGGEK